eukprot:2318424-Alexandrium_andersonii.AAC.1
MPGASALAFSSPVASSGHLSSCPQPPPLILPTATAGGAPAGAGKVAAARAVVAPPGVARERRG